jgi:hypothetical protein
MPPKTLGFDAVRRIALDLPHVEESTTYGSPCFKARGKLLACIPSHRSAEPDSLVVRVGFEGRAEMIADAPDVYYLPDHYVNYPFVLVRLRRIRPDALKDLLAMAWRLSVAKTTKSPAGAPRPVRKGTAPKT